MSHWLDYYPKDWVKNRWKEVETKGFNKGDIIILSDLYLTKFPNTKHRYHKGIIKNISYCGSVNVIWEGLKSAQSFSPSYVDKLPNNGLNKKLPYKEEVLGIIERLYNSENKEGLQKNLINEINVLFNKKRFE